MKNWLFLLFHQLFTSSRVSKPSIEKAQEKQLSFNVEQLAVRERMHTHTPKPAFLLYPGLLVFSLFFENNFIRSMLDSSKMK